MDLSAINADFSFLNGFKVSDSQAFYYTFKREKRPRTGKDIIINIFCTDLGTPAVVPTLLRPDPF
jgi:hypothetical protein